MFLVSSIFWLIKCFLCRQVLTLLRHSAFHNFKLECSIGATVREKMWFYSYNGCFCTDTDVVNVQPWSLFLSVQPSIEVILNIVSPGEATMHLRKIKSISFYSSNSTHYHNCLSSFIVFFYKELSSYAVHTDEYIVCVYSIQG